MAEDTLRNFAKAGGYPAKVGIDPDEFFAWCKARDTLNDAEARARFVSYKLRLADGERV